MCLSSVSLALCMLDKIRDQIVGGCHDATRLATLRNSAMPLAPHTQTQRHGELAMMTRPYKPRDSARSALLDCST